jgi:hypothetical protein
MFAMPTKEYGFEVKAGSDHAPLKKRVGPGIPEVPSTMHWPVSAVEPLCNSPSASMK